MEAGGAAVVDTAAGGETFCARAKMKAPTISSEETPNQNSLLITDLNVDECAVGREEFQVSSVKFQVVTQGGSRLPDSINFFSTRNQSILKFHSWHLHGFKCHE